MLAYRLAWRMGAQSVEPDVVMTRDGHLVCRHDLDLQHTTDIAERPEFAKRQRTLKVDGKRERGFWVHDFDLAEIRTLRAKERWPVKRPGSARYDGHVGVLTLDEALEVRAQESARAGRSLGLHVEVKSPGFFDRAGLRVDDALVDVLTKHGVLGEHSPVSVMTFEAALLKRLRKRIDNPSVRLFDADDAHGRRQLRNTLGYATGVGLHKELAMPLDGHGRVSRPGAVIGKAHALGLEVLVWTLRNENKHLPANLRQGKRPRKHGNAAAEVRRLIDAGVDGLLTDFPDTALAVVREQGGMASRVV